MGMQFIVTALQAEAAPLVQYFGLKQNTGARTFPCFESADIVLVVSGVGKVQSAIATTWILNRSESGKESTALNFGLCGCADKTVPLGTLVMINKITDGGSGRAFYPDLLLRHPLAESDLTTYDRPVFSPGAQGETTGMVDMEASGFFQAATKILPLERIHCLKLVSDYLEARKLKAKAIEVLVEARVGEIERVLSNGRIPVDRPPRFDSQDSQFLKRIEKSLRLTVTQRNQLQDWALGHLMRNGAGLEKLESFALRSTTNKRERSEALAAIKTILSR